MHCNSKCAHFTLKCTKQLISIHHWCKCSVSTCKALIDLPETKTARLSIIDIAPSCLHVSVITSLAVISLNEHVITCKMNSKALCIKSLIYVGGMRWGVVSEIIDVTPEPDAE